MNRLHKITTRKGMAGPFLMFAVIASLLILGWILSPMIRQRTEIPSDKKTEFVDPLSDNSNSSTSMQIESTANPARFAVTINRPLTALRVGTGMQDATGVEITVSCQTCHSTRPSNGENKQASDLDEFHAGLPLDHGNISCLSCHNSDDYDALKLADGTRIEYTEVMTLCSQCHGTQRRDYDRGAHGGMTGYWDLNRGPRQRNNCVDCHQPHAPQFPHMQPTFKPRDRFLDGSSQEAHEKHP